MTDTQQHRKPLLDPVAPEVRAMLNAHVSFELERWTGDRLTESLAQEIGELFTWLNRIRVDDVLVAEDLGAWIDRYVYEAPVSDQTVRMITEAVQAIHASALQDETPISDLLPRAVYDQYAGTVIGMTDVRRMITDQITTSDVYSQLISHVLYQGIKNYLLSESLLARRVPGASSLMRLGQSALSSAAPDLGKSIDRQLTAFVNANISDSIRESKQYLDSVVDDDVLWSVASEVWETNSSTTVADLAALVSSDALGEFVATGITAWHHLRSTPFLRAATVKLVGELLARHGSRPIGDVLTDAGISQELATQQLSDALTPVVARAAEDGFLEERIHSRLQAFYSSYTPADRI